MVASDTKNNTYILFIIFITAFAVRLSVVHILPTPEIISDASQYNEIAHSISTGNGYALKNGEPTAIRPPIYPVFLAGIYLLLGDSVMGVQVIQCLLLASCCIIIFFLGKDIFDVQTARIASCASAIYPMLIYPVYDLLSEALLILLFTLTIFFVLRSIKSKCYAAAAGALLSLSVLTKPIVFFALLFFMFFIFINGVKRFTQTAVFLIVFLAVLMPWTIRNYSVFQSFVPMGTGGGIALLDSHVLPSRGLGFSTKIPKEAESIKNEVTKDRFLTRYAIDYVINHPKKLIPQTILKIAMFFYPLDGYWYPFSLGSRYNIWWGTIFLFSIAGIYHGNRKNAQVQLLFLTIVSFFVAIIFFQGIPRYRLAIEPVFILLASSGFVHLIRIRKGWVTGILAFNIFAWLAFRYCDFHNLITWDRIKFMF